MLENRELRDKIYIWLDCKEIQPVHPKGNESWIFIGRTDVEAETAILWPPDVKNWLIWKAPDAGDDWRLEEKGKTEDEMVGWHHQLNGHELMDLIDYTFHLYINHRDYTMMLKNREKKCNVHACFTDAPWCQDRYDIVMRRKWIILFHIGVVNIGYEL